MRPQHEQPGRSRRRASHAAKPARGAKYELCDKVR
jgi:hypothetical protein